MRLRSCSFILVLLISAPLLYAERIPVVVSDPLSRESSRLQALDFRLHARCGATLIGTLPAGDLSAFPAEAVALAGIGSNFQQVYQIPSKNLPNDWKTTPPFRVIYAADTWQLVAADAEALIQIAEQGIPFRAISPQPFPGQGFTPTPRQTDDINPFVAVLLDEVSQTSYANYLQTLQDFDTRNTYTPQCDNAALWIQQQFESFGLTVELDTFQIGAYSKYNVIATWAGGVNPDDVYYITAHYDATAGLPVLPETDAPGADDDGSGTALVLECARVISQFDFNNTVRFAIFAGNEQGLVGSEAYVAGLPFTEETYLGVFNADMVGYPGTDPWPPDLVIYTNSDPTSLALTAKVNEAITTFVTGFLQPIAYTDPTMVYADHAPFWDAGIPAILAMEDEVWGTDLNPNYHSNDDLIQYLSMSYALHVLEAILASTADFAVPSGSTEPCLTAGDAVIDDSQGNNNGQIEYGESVYLTIPVSNVGAAGATSVGVTLSESDPYLTFSDWQENYGSIAPGQTVSITNAFAADVSTSVPDEHLFDVTVTMTAGSNSWQSLVQMVAHAPDLVIADVNVDDSVGGNNNGQLEPGESADLEITLQNDGSYQAISLSGTLSEANPDIFVNTSYNYYGNINPGASLMRAYNVTALATAPAYFNVGFSLAYSAAGGWTETDTFSIDVGNIMYTPTGPDAYGYSAYDIYDQPYAPTYQWIEIDPGQGGSGTLLNFTDDDQTLHVNLPFTFVYYGQNAAGISVCSNGWIALGYTEQTDYANSGIPNGAGPPAMIAPLWDDLSPQADGSVSYYHNAAAGLFIVEYYNVRDFYPTWAHYTFEVVFYNPVQHPTTTGDGKILFQYADLDNNTSYTAGIESPDEQTGIQYNFNGYYPSTATPIANARAILFTTGESVPNVTVTLIPYGAPIQIPATGGTFNFNISLYNNETSTIQLDVWCDITLPTGLPYGPVLGPVTVSIGSGGTIERDRFQNVPGSARAGIYHYNAYLGSYPSTIW
ncbi:MAG: M28 family peptidase, partial [bacterium]